MPIKSSKFDSDPALVSERSDTALLRNVPPSRGTRGRINLNPTSHSSPHPKSQTQVINKKAFKSPETFISITQNVAAHSTYRLLEVNIYIIHSPREESLTSLVSQGLAFSVLHVFSQGSCSFSKVNLEHLFGSYMEENQTAFSVTQISI